MAYTGTADLAMALNLRNVTPEQGTAMEIVLAAAMYEINSECNGSGTIEFGTPYPALAVDTNLERAVELWQSFKSPFGIIGFEPGAIPVHTARDTWDRHAHKLAPLKTTWGVA